MLRAVAALAARIDLAALAHVAADAPDVLEVDLLHLVDAERTDLAARPARSAVARAAAAVVTVAAASATAAAGAART